MEGETCSWCDGRGEVYPEYEFGGTCGWCDGTGVEKPSFHGHGGEGEHRTVGPIRAWCLDCREWCYARSKDMACECCIEMFQSETS